MPPIPAAFGICNYLLSLALSHFWFAIPQLVLQADWQEVWHSPQPPFLALSHRLRVSIVLICSIISPSILDLGESSLAQSIMSVNHIFHTFQIITQCAPFRKPRTLALENNRMQSFPPFPPLNIHTSVDFGQTMPTERKKALSIRKVACFPEYDQRRELS